MTKKRPANYPTRPLSAYNFFFREQRLQFMMENKHEEFSNDTSHSNNNNDNNDDHNDDEHKNHESNSNVQGDDRKQQHEPQPTERKVKSRFFEFMAKEVARRWKELSVEQRQKYFDLANLELERYRSEIEIFHQQHPEQMKQPSSSNVTKRPRGRPKRQDTGPVPQQQQQQHHHSDDDNDDDDENTPFQYMTYGLASTVPTPKRSSSIGSISTKKNLLPLVRDINKNSDGIKRGRGRPPGSLNKKTLSLQGMGGSGDVQTPIKKSILSTTTTTPSSVHTTTKGKRGRPPGSKNKQKTNPNKLLKQQYYTTTTTTSTTPKGKRGRPKGSLNKKTLLAAQAATAVVVDVPATTTTTNDATEATESEDDELDDEEEDDELSSPLMNYEPIDYHGY